MTSQQTFIPNKKTDDKIKRTDHSSNAPTLSDSKEEDIEDGEGKVAIKKERKGKGSKPHQRYAKDDMEQNRIAKRKVPKGVLDTKGKALDLNRWEKKLVKDQFTVDEDVLSYEKCRSNFLQSPDGSLYAFQNPEGIPSSILERQTTEAELRLQEDRRKLAQDKRDFEKEKSDFSKEKCRWAFERAEDEWEVEKQTRLANVGVPMQKALNRRKELDNHCMELQLRRREALALERLAASI